MNRTMRLQHRIVIPTFVTMLRVGGALLTVALIHSASLTVTLLVVCVVFGLDAVDGFVARLINAATLLGSFFDIAADRIVECVFFSHFASLGFVPTWFAVGFYARIIATDTCRYVAFNNGDVRIDGIVLPPHLRPWVLSTPSRTLYGMTKMALVAILIVSQRQPASIAQLALPTMFILTLIFSLVRGVPILITVGERVFNQALCLRPNHADFPNVAPLTPQVFACLAQMTTDLAAGALVVHASFR